MTALNWINDNLNPFNIYKIKAKPMINDTAENLETYGINDPDSEKYAESAMKFLRPQSRTVNDITEFLTKNYQNIPTAKKLEIDGKTVDNINLIEQGDVRKSTLNEIKKYMIELEKQKPWQTPYTREKEAIHDVAQKYAINTSVEEALNPANKLQAAKTPVAIGLAELGLAYCAIRYGPDVYHSIIGGSPESSAANADAIYQTIANTPSMNVETVATTTNNTIAIEELSPIGGSLKVVATNVDSVETVAHQMNETTTSFLIEDLKFNPPPYEVNVTFSTEILK